MVADSDSFSWKGGSYTNEGFFHSSYEYKPWLLIQIPSVQLYSVTTVNRKDCCGDHLVDLEEDPSGIREGGNWLFFVREFVKMKTFVRDS